VTKESFFHHFRSKEGLAISAAAVFADLADQMFGTAQYNELKDPLGCKLGGRSRHRTQQDEPVPMRTTASQARVGSAVLL
jgi:TetR/AcrR family transcriptional repressor of nem operon